MQTQQLKLGPLDTNTFILIDDSTQNCVVIDPADDASLIAEEILRQGLTLEAIIATHGHFDHNMAGAELQLNFDVPYYLHQDDEFLVESLNERASYWLGKKISLAPPKITHHLTDGQEIVFGETRLEVVHTPGHTPGCCCLIHQDSKRIFSGDTLFADDIPGRTDLEYSSPELMKKSLDLIKNKYQGFQGYPGHGRDYIV